MIYNFLDDEKIPVEVITLWSAPESGRQFLIPNACQLPSGDFLLSTVTGREWRVDPAALAGFEVSDEEAKAWLKEQLKDVMKKLGTGMSEAQSPEAALSSAEEKSNKPGASDDTQKSSATPGLDLLADITGTPRESLSADYAAVGRAFRSYLENMAGTTSDAISGELDRMEAAREHMRRWAETLREHGVAAPSVSPAHADNTPAQTQDTPTEAIPSATNEPSPETQKKTSFSDRLRELAENFRHRADALAATRQAKDPEQPNVDKKSEFTDKDTGGSQKTILPLDDAKRAAEALEAVAQGLEGAAGDAAKNLRDLAVRLRTSPQPDNSAKPPADDFSDKS